MRIIFTLLMALGVQLFTAQDADARRGGAGYTQALEFVAMTSVDAQNGSPLALCVLVQTQTAMSISYWRSEKGYALAENRCEVDQFLPVNAEQLQLLKAEGVVPAHVPATPQVDTGLALPMWAWVVLAVVLGAAGLGWKRKAARKSQRGALMGNASPAAVAILDAMCHAAKADGEISPSEIAEIAHAAQEMTGEAIDPKAVAEMAQLAEGALVDRDFKRLVAGRTEVEREVMMRAVLYVSVADGTLDGKEQTFVGKLAGAMKMPGDRIQQLLREVVAARAERAAV